MKSKQNADFLKKTVFILLSVSAAVAFSAAISFASGGEGGGSPVKGFILKMINLSIFLGVIIYFVKKPLKNFLNDRQEKVKDTIKNSDAALEKAVNDYKEMENKLKRLSVEVKELTDKIKHEGEQEKERIIDGTKSVVEKIKRDTEEAIKREFESVQKRVREETIEHSINAAEEIILKKFKASDQEKIADMIAKEIEGTEGIGAFLTKSETPKAQLLSATEINESSLKNITSSLKKAIGRDIEVEVIKDPSIVGGIIAKVGSLVLDASIKAQLATMREKLKSEVG